MWDTDRVGPPNASRVMPTEGWQQGALLASWSTQPTGNVRASLQFNVTPADVMTDIRGTPRRVARASLGALPGTLRLHARETPRAVP